MAPSAESARDVARVQGEKESGRLMAGRFVQGTTSKRITLKYVDCPVSVVQFQVVLEHDSDSGHVTATVPRIPGIIVDALSEEEALEMAREAISFWRDENQTMTSEHVQAKIATVEA